MAKENNNVSAMEVDDDQKSTPPPDQTNANPKFSINGPP